MYKVIKNPSGTNSYSRVIDGEGIAFVESPGNRDWEEFQEWLKEGNEPEELDFSNPIVSDEA